MYRSFSSTQARTKVRGRQPFHCIGEEIGRSATQARAALYFLPAFDVRRAIERA